MPGVYIHLPFCSVHCTYCPFAISTDSTLQDAYTGAVVQEIRARGGGEAPTVYFGGGTPSRTAPLALRKIMDAVRERYDVAADAEVTLEANPEDVSEAAVAAWLESGITRLSIGVQSFSDPELRRIGRIHDSETAERAVSLSVASGIRTTLDLIAGLPEQTPESFFASLERAIGLGVGHLSLYMLDLDEQTPLRTQVARGRVTIPPDETVADLYVSAVERLERAALHQVEISNFARQGEESRHNLIYWNRGEYDGFGLAAHSFRAEKRFANTRNMQEYLARPENAVVFTEVLSEEERRHELIFLGLRQARGLSYEALAALGGEEAGSWIDRGLRDGWLRREGDQVAFTPSGFVLSSEYISQLF